MGEGFFSSDKLVRRNILPPVLKIKVPREEKKEKKVTILEPGKPQMLMDIECYVNYFLVKFRRVSDDKITDFEMTEDFDLDRKGIRRVLRDYEIITFKGNTYDILMLKYALQYEDVTNEELKAVSDELIKTKISKYNFEQKYKLDNIRNLDHIDLIELAPVRTSLKTCGGRLHCDVLQDLPFPEEAVLTEDEMDEVSTYCGYDLEDTKLLLIDLQREIQIRRVMSKKYGIDLLSSSDAQIAEKVIKLEAERRTGIKIKRTDPEDSEFYYQIPDFIKFTNPDLNNVLDILRNNKLYAYASGSVKCKALSKLKIRIGKTIYTMGLGGLHSTEKYAFHLSDDKFDIFDWDVTSYYPAIILICGLFPEAIGKVFLEIYQDFYDERVKIKHIDEILAAMLKIFLNGTYGKTGSPYSILYSPDLMIQVTLTGQLAVLMLIDAMERRGFPVVSGNTDGIVIKCERGKEATMRSIIEMWSKRTGLTMESTSYAGLYSRDVNNYIAIKYDGTAKLKGCFALTKRHKNPESEICSLAMVEYLKYGTPVEDTIRECKDIRKFVTVQKVNGGAVKDGVYLGKTIRWYYSTKERGTINYKLNNNKVPLSDGARPIMDLRVGFPKDIDYNWYINHCRNMLVKPQTKGV